MFSFSKNKGIILFVLVCLFLLAACGESNEGNADSGNTNDTEKESDESVDVDKGLLNVEVTIPSSFFESEEQDKESIIADAEAQEGISKVTENSDGSLTYKMSKSKHNEMMDEMETEINSAMEELKNGEDFVSIEDITSNKSYSAFTMIVDREAFENSFDGLAALSLGMSGMLYQLFEGVSPEEYNVTISFEDVSTGEVFDTVEYPEALEEIEG